MEKLGTIALMVLWLGACTSPTASPTRLSTSTATQPALDQTGILVGVVDANAALSSPWQPPSLEQARAGVGGNVPAGVSDQMAIYEGQAKLRMPQDAAAMQSSWNGASIENTGRDDLIRIATYGKNKAGNIIWSRLDGGPSFNEYPISWYYDANGALQVLLEQEFGEIPDSKDAVVIFSGDASGSGDSFTFGEKPAIVKDIAAMADGTQYHLEYFDFQEAAWKLNSAVLQALAPDGYTVSQDESGNWLALADNQAMLNFDLAKKAWIEALPPLPQGTGEIQFVDGEYHYLNAELDKNVVVKIVENINTDGETQRWITPADHPDWPLFIENEDGSWREAMVYVEVTKRVIDENGQETPFLGEDLIWDIDPYVFCSKISPVVIGEAYLGEEGYLRLPAAVPLDENPESPMLRFNLVLGDPEDKTFIINQFSGKQDLLTYADLAKKLETGTQITFATLFDFKDRNAYEIDWSSQKKQYPKTAQDYMELSAKNLWQNTIIISALRDGEFVDALFRDLEIWAVAGMIYFDF